MNNVIIIGGGPAGLTAAIYTSRANVKTLLLEPELEGGQAALTLSLENYPGSVKGDSGMDIAMRMREQAVSFGTEIVKERVESVEVDGDEKVVKTDGGEYRAKYVIVCTGSKPNTLGVPGEEKFVSRGVSYCATCDGAFYQNGDVYVIGGGNSAVEEALYLANLGAKVHIVHRRSELRAEGFLADQAKNHENIEILWNTELKELWGEKALENLVLYNNKTDERFVIEKKNRPLGVFIYVGIKPQTEFLEGLLDLNKGQVPVDKHQMTAVDGIYAAGDIVDKDFKQVVTACSDGCIAAMDVARRITQYD
ncbi:MAG: thioredoxin-disulfide reductase [Firmicutes bacterium]|nr:thioredoxin-disulfide reductase [Bacillota bacterium]